VEVDAYQRGNTEKASVKVLPAILHQTHDPRVFCVHGNLI